MHSFKKHTVSVISVLVFVFFLLLLCVTTLPAQEFVKGEVVVKFKPGIIDFPQGSKRLPISAISLNSPAVANRLQNLNATELEKIFFEKAPGDTIGYHVRTSQPVRIIDQSQVYVIILPEEADIPAVVKA